MMTAFGYHQLAKARCLDKGHDKHDTPPCAGCAMDALVDMYEDRKKEGRAL